MRPMRRRRHEDLAVHELVTHALRSGVSSFVKLFQRPSPRRRSLRGHDHNLLGSRRQKQGITPFHGVTSARRILSERTGGPMTDRRAFLHSLAAGAATLSLPTFNPRAIRRLTDAHVIAGARPAAKLADDEVYWSEIQRAFDLDRTMINLNNGGCSPAPTHVLDQMIRDLRFSNELPVEHMWGVLEPRIESVRRELARDSGCDPEEMAIVRNASEANETMIFGLDLQRGDEVIFTTQNYPRMQNAWKQRERRDGIVLKPVRIETPVKSVQSYVDHIANAIT